jgi:hypothetical protein
MPTENKSLRPKKTSFLEFWTTLPGILTALASLIAAIAAVAVSPLFDHTEKNPNPSPKEQMRQERMAQLSKDIKANQKPHPKASEEYRRALAAETKAKVEELETLQRLGPQ